MSFDPKAIANYFLDLAESEKIPIEPLKLQKLVYFAHGWYLAFTGKPLLNEFVEAWQYGPVIPDLYHAFKHYGSQPITGRAFSVQFEGSKIRTFVPRVDDVAANDTLDFTKNLLNRVWNVYKSFTGIQLSSMTHQPGSPWSQTRTETQGMKNADISNDRIRQYFLKLNDATAQ